MKRFLVLVNPSSHGGRSRRQAATLSGLLPEGEFVTTRNIGEAFCRARDAVGFDAVVACGGDGTIRAVASGVLANGNPALRFGVLYTGTSPDFCRDHGLPVEPRAAVGVLRRFHSRQIPVLTANGEPFFCSLNLGIGAEVAAGANRLRPLLGDALGTFVPLVRGLCRMHRYDLCVNGERMTDCVHALVTRTPFIAGGLKLSLPRLADDEYALWCVRDLPRWGWGALVVRMYRGEPCGEFRILRGETHVVSSARIAVEYDGDPQGELPLRISFSPRKLELIA